MSLGRGFAFGFALWVVMQMSFVPMGYGWLEFGLGAGYPWTGGGFAWSCISATAAPSGWLGGATTSRITPVRRSRPPPCSLKGWRTTPEAGDRELRRQLATLTYSQLTPAVPADAITAAGWWNLLGRLGPSDPAGGGPRLRAGALGRPPGRRAQIRHDGAGREARDPGSARYQIAAGAGGGRRRDRRAGGGAAQGRDAGGDPGAPAR